MSKILQNIRPRGRPRGRPKGTVKCSKPRGRPPKSEEARKIWMQKWEEKTKIKRKNHGYDAKETDTNTDIIVPKIEVP